MDPAALPADATARIAAWLAEEAVDASYVLNAGGMGGGLPIVIMIGQTNGVATRP